MAKSKLTYEEITQTVIVKEPIIQLELNVAEAVIIRDMLARTGAIGYTQDFVQSLKKSLDKYGIDWPCIPNNGLQSILYREHHDEHIEKHVEIVTERLKNRLK